MIILIPSNGFGPNGERKLGQQNRQEEENTKEHCDTTR
jgi:hypothetical protein